MSPPDNHQSEPTEASGRAEPSLGDDGALLLWAALEGLPDARSALTERFTALRRRLAQRVAASVRASDEMVTARYAPPAMVRANSVARLQTLYLAAEGPMRPGEPLNVLLMELAPDGTLPLDPPASGVQREWLLVRGGVRLSSAAANVSLAPLDYHVEPASLDGAGPAPDPIQLRAGADGALLYLRESLTFPAPGEVARTVRDDEAPWKPFAPRVERRVLWRQGPLAAMLFRAQPGAAVPHHAHGHDEECLVLRGETFQEETLLREGDYQLAPAGSSHTSASTDVGAIFYIHGDLQLDLKAPAESPA